MRMAMGALVNVNVPPSSLIFNAVFHAIEFSSRAPNMIPLFPFRRLNAISIFILMVQLTIIQIPVYSDYF
jgi:hypothetical protein